MKLSIGSEDELRLLVVGKSLAIESELSKVLRMFFRIDHSDSKTLGFKGSALSFKNKIDILFDLGFIDKVLYPKFQMFMELRNQIMHNIEIDSMTKASLQSRTRNKLAILLKETNSIDQDTDVEELSEKDLRSAFKILSLDLEIKVAEIGLSVMRTLEAQEQALLESTRYKVTEENFLLLLESIREASKELNSTLSNKDYNSELGEIFGMIILEKYRMKVGYKERTNTNES